MYFKWRRNLWVEIAVICNMMHKKQGITGHHDQSVACKFKNLRLDSSREEQNTNHIKAFNMHNAGGCRTRHHHISAEPTEWERWLQPQPRCIKKTDISHMKPSTHR